MMRRPRRPGEAAFMMLAALGILLGVVAATSSPAGACSLIVADQIFVGRVEAVDGTTVTFRVIGSDRALSPKAPADGATVRVRYGDEAAFVDVGTDYQVEAWRHADGELGSHVARDGHDCGDRTGTRLADGTFVDRAGLLPLAWSCPTVGGLVAVATLAGVAWYPRHRRKQRRSPRSSRTASA